MPHVFGHDVTADCGRRTAHDEDGNQLIPGESQADGNGYEEEAQTD